MNIISFFIILLFLPISFAADSPTANSEDIWGQAKQALYQGNIKQVGEILYRGFKKETNGHNMPYSSYGEILRGKGEEAIQLVSCVVLDMLALVEREFGQNGQTFSRQMQNILVDIERLKPQELSTSNDIERIAYQKAHKKGVKSAHLTCKQANKEYELLKQEIEKLFSPLTGRSTNKKGHISPIVLENTKRTFYYSILSTRYNSAVKTNEDRKKANWKPLD